QVDRRENGADRGGNLHVELGRQGQVGRLDNNPVKVIAYGDLIPARAIVAIGTYHNLVVHAGGGMEDEATVGVAGAVVVERLQDLAGAVVDEHHRVHRAAGDPLDIDDHVLGSGRAQVIHVEVAGMLQISREAETGTHVPLAAVGVAGIDRARIRDIG